MFDAQNEFALLSDEITTQRAGKYYRESVAGNVGNVHGDRIRIGPQELNFMFEKKNVRHGMFFVNRARRLPWIRPTIEMTKIIKLEERKRKWRELYLADFGIPMRMLGVKVPVPQWFCVVVGRHGDQRFFVTAYPIDQIEQKLSLPDAYPREDTPKGSS